MRQRGEVVKIDANRAWVKVADPSSACGNCKGCIRLSPQERHEDQVLELDNTLAVTKGDWVIVESTSKDITKSLLVLYGIPLLGLILGYIISLSVLQSDTLAALGSLGGLVIFAFIARPVARRVAKGVQVNIVARACP